jgi:hypothetical protein
VVGILVFVGAPATATWQSALLYGAVRVVLPCDVRTYLC